MRKELTDKINFNDIEKYIPKGNVKVWEVEDNDGLWELRIMYGGGDSITKHHYDTKKRTLYLDFKFYQGLQAEKGFDLLIPAGTKKIKVGKVEYYKSSYKKYDTLVLARSDAVEGGHDWHRTPG